MSDKQPLQWGKIMLCAVLSGVISMGIGYLVLSQLFQFGTTDDLQVVVESFIAMGAVVLSYFVLTPIVAFLLSLVMVHDRRVAHVALAVLISIPFSVLLALAVGTVSG